VTIRIILFLGVLLLASVAKAQTPSDLSVPTGGERRNGSKGDSDDAITEMKFRREIKAWEKSHEENLGRAREAANLGTEIEDSYAKNASLNREDLKKLDRLEKLTRKIRSEAGGSEGETNPSEPPSALGSALKRVVEISGELRKGVENTPRQVISALVIERANQLLETVRYIRFATR
jgi:hypothetical protein